MKHKRAGRKNWHRAVADEEQVIHVPQGVIVDYTAGEVTKPLIVAFKDKSLRILDTAYRWVHFAPHGKNLALTVQLDEKGVPQQLYVDICDGHGLDPDGIPFVNDLYLDVIALCEVQPDGHWRVTDTEIIDQHELEEALGQGKVTQAQYDLAWAEARAVEAALRAGTFEAAETVRQYLTDPYT